MSYKQAQPLQEHEQHELKEMRRSRLVERAMGYSWIKYGWDTVAKTYDSVKHSNNLAKYGCELAEGNVNKIVSSSVVENSYNFLAPLIVLADEFAVNRLDTMEKSAEYGNRLVHKTLVQPASATYNAITSLPTRFLDRAECFVDHYLPDNQLQHSPQQDEAKSDEGPAAAEHIRTEEARIAALQRSVSKRAWDLSWTTALRCFARMEGVVWQAREQARSNETMNALIAYLKTNDPEKKQELINHGRETYWYWRKNSKAIFVHYARAVVQPVLVRPSLKLYYACDRALKRIFLRGPFSPFLATPANPSS